MPLDEISPIRKQYLEIKKNFQDAIVFFRLGDFYETFDHDAEITSRELDIVLTSRNVSKRQRVPMAGIPFHAADNYISRLISKGYHVAICEQIGEQPQKGLFPRKVIRVITPGTIIKEGLLSNEKNNYLVSIFPHMEDFGFAYADITTGEFFITQFEGVNSSDQLNSEISRIHPSEILIPESSNFKVNHSYFTTELSIWKFERGRCESFLKRHFNVVSLEGFGCKNKPFAIIAAGVILEYVNEKDPSSLSLFKDMNCYSLDDFMLLDDSTRRNLELTETLRRESEKGSLMHIIDQTQTPMGRRLIRKWVNQPLIHVSEIENRLSVVDYFYKNGVRRNNLREILKKFSDVERIISRIISEHATPRDLVSLRNSLALLPQIQHFVEKIHELLQNNYIYIQSCQEEHLLLLDAIVEEPPATLQNIGIIRAGYSDQLDALIESTKQSRDWIANLEVNEKKRTGIKTLKVGYNKIYGYYIEISKGQSESAPQEYIRKQTLVNAERFITPELKEYESIILNAEDRIREVENQLFKQVCGILSHSSEKTLSVARSIAGLDVLLSFSQVASENNYSKPEIFDDRRLDIKDGRHPVVEKTQFETAFIPNDTQFGEDEIIQIITGPNMSGKSTYLRQVALIVLMAQIGSFVPVKNAKIGIVDRIFTRIGAQDEIYSGQSTFMVEMIETANILRNATEKSMLILDEIGRGTSTYDGLSIAWAVLEYIHNHPRLKGRTLFATHYHELTMLSEIFPKMKNYNVAVSEDGKNVVFLHKIIEGKSDRSYGIHVAQLAGIPFPVIQRATELLNNLENKSDKIKTSDLNQTSQIPLFLDNNPVIDELQELDLNSLSPIEALNKLYDWKKLLKN